MIIILRLKKFDEINTIITINIQIIHVHRIYLLNDSNLVLLI